MNILIFGVGRSGTKAVQLYLSYLLSQKNGSAWINYEPYFWLNRKTVSINYEGLYHHSSSPHIATDPSQLSRRHRNFLQQLSNHKEDVITKFIRGNGRTRAIIPLIQPDHTFVIVRDLYQVLKSVLRTNWDFLSVGFEYKLNWENFMNEVRRSGLVERYDWCDSQINDRIDKNAFYWFVMNLAAFEYSGNDANFISYSEINRIETFARQFLGIDNPPPINNPIFNGDYIHGDYPLISDQSNLSAKEFINGLLYKSQVTDKYGVYLSSKSIGSRVKINNEYTLIEGKEPKPTELSIEKRDLYEYFNEVIADKLSNIQKNSMVQSA